MILNSSCKVLQAADIWSLGVTLYCLVVGKVPFQGQNVPVVYEKIKTEKIKVGKRYQYRDKTILTGT